VKGMEVVERGMIMMTGSRITSLYCNEMSRVSEDAEWHINHDEVVPYLGCCPGSHHGLSLSQPSLPPPHAFTWLG
jgi:hypothetical protein